MKVLLQTHLRSRGSEAHDNAGLVFCTLTCADGDFFTEAFNESEVAEKDGVMFVPAEADFVPGTENMQIQVRPSYVPYLWDARRQRPPEVILVGADKVVIPDG